MFLCCFTYCLKHFLKNVEPATFSYSSEVFYSHLGNSSSFSDWGYQWLQIKTGQDFVLTILPSPYWSFTEAKEGCY